MRVLRTNQHVSEHGGSENSAFCENEPELGSRSARPDERQNVGYTSRRHHSLDLYTGHVCRSCLERAAGSEYNEAGYLAHFFGFRIRPMQSWRLLMCLAVPGKILETKEENGIRLGRVQFGGITRQVQLDFVPEAAVGDYVIVHVGFALSKLNAEEAERTYQLLEEMGMLEEELGVSRESGVVSRKPDSPDSGSPES
jgi:hydrogenase expression/formation protein HypC